MKFFTQLFLAFLCSVSLLHADELRERIGAVPNPRPTGGWVADPSGLIQSRTAQINALISAQEAKDGTEIAVVVLPTIGKLVPKEFAVALFNTWKIGKADKDNGLLVLHILDQRRVEIETGYGMEGTLPDVKCKWILDEIGVPFFKASSSRRNWTVSP
ncbi:MAG: TPM domain-containing protein [Spirochaetia bacterium]|nr:TPM domain-containing protein [Spirochaetia bacterium]